MYAPGYVSFDIAGEWPVQASGRQLAAYAKWKGGRLPTEPELRVFLNKHLVDKPGANIGFRNWHPVPPTLPGITRTGEFLGAHNGGVFEWTSTVFDKHEGYSPSILYPGYSVGHQFSVTFHRLIDMCRVISSTALIQSLLADHGLPFLALLVDRRSGTGTRLNIPMSLRALGSYMMFEHEHDVRNVKYNKIISGSIKCNAVSNSTV